MCFVHCFTLNMFAFSLRCNTSSQCYGTTSIMTDCLGDGSLSTSTFPQWRLIAAVELQISQHSNDSSCSLQVVVYKTRDMDSTACIPVWSIVKRLRNQIPFLDSRFLAIRHTATSKAVHHTHFRPKYDAAKRGLATRD